MERIISIDTEKGPLNPKPDEVKLTSSGLAIRLPLGTSFYCSNTGNFRRYMSTQEWECLDRCIPIHLEGDLKVFLPEPWKFLWSWTHEDRSQYKPGMSLNGGAYILWKQFFLFARVNNEVLELIVVTKHGTSSEFDYDEVDGVFQNQDMGWATFIDTEEEFCLWSQVGEGGKKLSLNQVGTPISLIDALWVGKGSVLTEEREMEKNPVTEKEVEAREELIAELFGRQYLSSRIPRPHNPSKRR